MEKHFILMLESDQDDQYITQSMFEENGIPVDLEFSGNSNQFMHFLAERAADGQKLPSLIILSIHSFPMNALDILKKIKSDERFSFIPVVVLSNISNTRVVKEHYSTGACSFIVKPDSNEATRKKILNFLKYWFETVELV